MCCFMNEPSINGVDHGVAWWQRRRDGTGNQSHIIFEKCETNRRDCPVQACRYDDSGKCVVNAIDDGDDAEEGQEEEESD